MYIRYMFSLTDLIDHGAQVTRLPGVVSLSSVSILMISAKLIRNK
jgi:hypothetical protein